jgi:nitronate monooxygenase
MMSLQSLLGIELPIIQAPMAGVQGSALAAAVSNAGGLGSLPAAMLIARRAPQGVGGVGCAHVKAIQREFLLPYPPVADAARESSWRQALAPFYEELGLSIDAIAVGPGANALRSECRRRAR